MGSFCNARGIRIARFIRGMRTFRKTRIIRSARIAHANRSLRGMRVISNPNLANAVNILRSHDHATWLEGSAGAVSPASSSASATGPSPCS